jgi:hypothetical protein
MDLPSPAVAGYAKAGAAAKAGRPATRNQNSKLRMPV